MTNTKPVEVGMILDNGDTVFHITDTEYWVVASITLWEESTWVEGVEHCLLNGYEMPDRETLELIYTHKDDLPVSPTSNVWSSTEYNSRTAWNLTFGNGSWYNNYKANSYWVVPFRKIAKTASDAVVGKTVPSTDQVQSVYTEGVYKVSDITGTVSVVDRIHCDLDNHTVDKGYPVERTPVVVGGKEIPLADLPYPVLLMGVRDRKSDKVVLYAAPLPNAEDVIPTRKVVCAACRNGDYTLVGPRHFCSVMHTQADAYVKLGLVDDRKWEQGFIDQWERFMDRHEALLVALAAGQPVDFERNSGSGNELYSEGLY